MALTPEEEAALAARLGYSMPPEGAPLVPLAATSQPAPSEASLQSTPPQIAPAMSGGVVDPEYQSVPQDDMPPTPVAVPQNGAQPVSDGSAPQGQQGPAVAGPPAPQYGDASRALAAQAIARLQAERDARSRRGLGSLADDGGTAPVSGGPKNPLPAIQKRAEGDAAEAKRAAEEAGVSLDVASQHQQDAVTEVGEAKSRAYEGTAGISSRMAGEADAQHELALQRQIARNEAMAKTEREIQDINSEADKITPKDRRTTAQRVGSIIAMSLATVGDAFMALAGQKGTALNDTMAILDANVQKDLDEQREALSRKRATAKAKESELGRAREKYGDDIAADKIAYDMMLKKYEFETQALLNTSLSEQARAEAQNLLGQIQEKRALNQQEISTRIYERNQATAEQAALQRYQSAQAAAAARMRSDPTIAELEAEAAAGTITAPRMEMLSKARLNAANAEKARQEAVGGGDAGKPGGGSVPPSRVIYDPARWNAADKKAREDFGVAEDNVRALNRDINELDQMLQKYGTEGNWGLGTESDQAAEKMRALKINIQAKLKDSLSLGAWDNGTAQLLSEMVGDPNETFTRGETVRTRLRTVKDAVNFKQNEFARRIGLQSPQVDFKPKGQ